MNVNTLKILCEYISLSKELENLERHLKDDSSFWCQEGIENAKVEIDAIKDKKELLKEQIHYDESDRAEFETVLYSFFDDAFNQGSAEGYLYE